MNPPPMATPPSVLVVGAGAVGQMFARHLQPGGAQTRLLAESTACRGRSAGLPVEGLTALLAAVEPAADDAERP